MNALTPPTLGYATGADHGDECNIHPNEKQWVSARLANAALALVYEKPAQWKSPTHKSAQPQHELTANGASAVQQLASDPAEAGVGNAKTTVVTLAVRFANVGSAGFEERYPYNLRGSYNENNGPSTPSKPNQAAIVGCSASFPINTTTNASMTDQCAWASLEVEGVGWVNATISLVGTLPTEVLLTAAVPAAATAASSLREQGAAVASLPRVTGSAYGWGPIQ